jgi:chorismate dehydratase
VKTATLRVARIPFLNTDPFFTEDTAAGFKLISASPRELGRLAAEGKVDAGPLAVVDYWSLEGLFEPVGRYGIAVKKKALSVLLFSRKPLDGLAGAVIGVTDQTSTSARLLQIILRSRYGVEAAFRAGFKADDAARLIIGDDALKARVQGVAGFEHVVDLAEEWNDWRKLPFVFARWAVRKTAPAYLKEELAERLEAALKANTKKLSVLAAAGARRLKLKPEDVSDYFEVFTYRLGPAELKAEEAFRDLVTGKVPGCGC